jgi:transposase-like protein
VLAAVASRGVVLEVVKATGLILLAAIYLKVREASRSVSVAVTIATRVNTDGRYEVLCMTISLSKAETYF